MDIYLKGKRIRLDPQQSIGKGGEADVFSLGQDQAVSQAVKIFKPPNHPDFNGSLEEQEKAKLRLIEHQSKLPAFPNNLPPSVITPQELVTNQSGKQILGYTMPFLAGAEVLFRYSERRFRESGVSDDTMMAILKSLHGTVTGVHAAKVVIGDFNDLNILVIADKAYLIDADSFQFGPYFCRMFTTRFVDPLVCDRSKLMLIKPHTPDTDWYAYTIMLMKCLLFAGPYDGIYRPKNAKARVNHDDRPLKRITVFNPEVRYPKPARPWSILPDDLLQHFHLVFEKDWRGEFPLNLIEKTRWTKCTVCQTEHARTICPNCAQLAPAVIKETIQVRGRVTATQFFKTSGQILISAMQAGKLLWLYREGSELKRENKEPLELAISDPQMRFRFFGEKTLLGKQGYFLTSVSHQPKEVKTVDSYGLLPLFDANETYRYWIESGILWRDGLYGPEQIGDVLANQTLFWVGAKFGFGFYRAGNMNVAFVFDAFSRGLNDNVKMPPIKGQLVDSTCVFSGHCCWFFTSSQIAGKLTNRCLLIQADGKIIAQAETEANDGSWLGTIRGKTAAGQLLFAPTDDGLVQIKADSGQLFVSKEFPDTEPFVSQDVQLLAGRDGIYVVNSHTICRLEIK